MAAILPLLAVLALVWFASVMGNAQAQILDTAQIEIIPPNPTTSDNISMRLFNANPYFWRDSCHPKNPVLQPIVGNLIPITTSNPDPICFTALWEWDLTPLSIGKLPCGNYDVEVTHTAPSFPGVVIGQKSFTVGCAVGGTTDLLTGGSDAPASAAEGSGSSAPLYAALIAVAVAVAAVALAASGWYAWRRLS